MRELHEKPVRKPWSPTRRRGGTLEEQISRTIANVGVGAVPASGRAASTRVVDAMYPPPTIGAPESVGVAAPSVIVTPEEVNVGIGAKPDAPPEFTAEERELERQRKEIDEEQRKLGRELRTSGIDWIRKNQPSKLTEALAMVREGVKIERDAMGVGPADARIPNKMVVERMRWMTVAG